MRKLSTQTSPAPWGWTPIVGGILLWSASLLQLFDPFPEDASTPLAALLAASGWIWTARVHEKTRPKSKEAT